MSNSRRMLGVITRGSLVEGVEMKLDAGIDVEDIRAGKFVVIEGKKNEFFSLITDVRLDATNPEILNDPPDVDNEVFREILSGTSTFATISLRPMLTLEKDEILSDETRPVKTIPAHFSQVMDAEENDVARIFGSEKRDVRFFNIGTPLDMETPVCLNLDRFIERSNGIFGKTGTGKTFLTRLVLAGLVKSNKAVNLIFDMHNEYGHQGMKEGDQSFVKGLRQIFGNKVVIFSVDPESTRKRGAHPDEEVRIGLDEIEVEDILTIAEELNLSQTAAESGYLLYNHYGRNWLKEFLALEGDELESKAGHMNAHKGALSALHRKLKRLEDFPFIDEVSVKGREFVNVFLEHIERGNHIVLEFGRQTSMLCYLLVASIVTRRIHEAYTRKSEIFFATQNPADRPRQLVITIEEAHKFLNPAAAKQTIFGVIAREMRKYYVSLLIVDQRPSGIDEEVMSQVGTKIVALLNDEKDISAVLTGVSNAGGIRSVLASLDSKQQALVFGHAVPMPVVVRTRDYDETFYGQMGMKKKRTAEKDKADLFG